MAMISDESFHNFPTSSYSSSSIEDIFATIQAMKSQEESYRAASPSLPPSSSSDARYKMLDWSFKVADFCKFHRETVVIAANYLDRYLAERPISPNNRKLFQLLAMTCLYTAVKIHEPEAMPPSLLANLSQGCYTSGDVVRMERELLKTLRWKCNPPTPQSFVRTYLDLLETNNDAIEQHILQVTQSQIELAVLQQRSFGGVRSSTIAYAAIANALSAASAEMDTLVALCEALQLNLEEIVDLQDRLYRGMYGQETTGDVDSNSNHQNDGCGGNGVEPLSGEAMLASHKQQECYSPRTTITSMT